MSPFKKQVALRLALVPLLAAMGAVVGLPWGGALVGLTTLPLLAFEILSRDRQTSALRNAVLALAVLGISLLGFVSAYVVRDYATALVTGGYGSAAEALAGRLGPLVDMDPLGTGPQYPAFVFPVLLGLALGLTFATLFRMRAFRTSLLPALLVAAVPFVVAAMRADPASLRADWLRSPFWALGIAFVAAASGGFFLCAFAVVKMPRGGAAPGKTLPSGVGLAGGIGASPGSTVT